MNIRKMVTSSTVAAGLVAGVFVGGVVMAAPASADTCNSSSFELFTATTGYCFDSPKDWSPLYNVRSYCASTTLTARMDVTNSAGSWVVVVLPSPNKACNHLPGYPGAVNSTITNLETY